MAGRRQVGAQRRGGAETTTDRELWSAARRRYSLLVWGVDRPPSLQEWADIGRHDRLRLARRASVVAGSTIVGSNVLVGLETFLLVQLAYNGGQLTFDATLGAPNFPAVVTAIVTGLVVNVVLVLGTMIPQLRWFISGEQADRGRRRSVQRIPAYQAVATVLGWVIAVLTYIVLSLEALNLDALVGIGVAFSLAGVSIACLTYLFAERSARPMLMIALQDQPATDAVQGVRARMTAVWVISSAVPMTGLLVINVGRWKGMLPAVVGRIDWTTVILAMVGLVAGMRVISLVGQALIDPITELRRAVQHVQHGDLSTHVDVYDSSELGVLQHGFNEMVSGLGERERMRELFARHVGDTVAELAIENGLGMHGANCTVGVLFVDIVGSTTIAEQRTPEDTAKLLNVFFSIVADVVDLHGGFVNKFEGDAALAVFGAPVELDDPAGAALGAGRDLARGLTEALDIRWGIGVSFGTVFAGNIGAEQRYEYTVIGGPVNECARLSEMARGGRYPVLASGAAVLSAAAEAQHWTSIDQRVLRGRSAATEIFAPIGGDGRTPLSMSELISGIVEPAKRIVTGRSR
ncbi:MAG: adenylate/guanylate cyclase domain-containing protein [Gordonia sp. (in: high G+C Gram-positive bacteria)]